VADNELNLQGPLPSSNRADDAVQGHWLLARLGKRAPRPGGVELSRTLQARAEVACADVLELAPDLGRTASAILAGKPAGSNPQLTGPQSETWV
jgi:hypothetical protein